MKMMTRLFFILFFISAFFVRAQGDVTLVGSLPNEVFETSGLIFYNGKLITHNDSGNSAQLFEIDTLSLEVTRTVTISNATNIDWEDLTQDEDYIYIGDFGNNLGNRQDLTIYRIPKSDYDTTDSVTAERIDFAFGDQTEFSNNQNSDWDAEALISFNDRLIIFTKQWQSNGTVAYAIPKTIGSHSAVNLGAFDSQGLITGATYNDLSNALFMVGYSQQLQPFTIRMDDLSDTFSFNDTREKTNLNLGFAQIEGIAHVDVNHYFITSERFVNNNPPITLQAGLFSFKTDDTATEEEDPGEENPGEGENPEEENNGRELVLFRQFGSKELQYELNMDLTLFGRAIFDTSGRRIAYTNANDIENNTIDLSPYRSSVYYLTFYLQGRTISKPFILD